MLISSILIALDTPDAGSTLKDTLMNANVIMTSIFTIEMIIKCVAKGFLFCGPCSYIRDPWNVVDFIITITSILDTLMPNDRNIGFFKVLKLLRAVRPLRLISRNEGLKLALIALSKSVPSLL